MKYSIVMPYYKRPELRYTLDSYAEYYGHRNDIEVIIVEDSKNFNSEEMHGELVNIVKRYESKVNVKTILDPKFSYCSASKYNNGVKVSSGSIIMLTNPESPHNFDFFEKFDEMDFSNTYLVCACVSVNVLVDRGTFFNSDLGFSQWYQHSIHRNAMYHFCSVISKDNFNKIGGFDERYSDGYCFEDDNFVKRVQKHGINIVTRDDIFTYHIEHPRDYSLTPEESEKLKNRNLELWRHQLETGDF